MEEEGAGDDRDWKADTCGELVCVCVSRCVCVSMQQKKTRVYNCSVCLFLSPTRASTHTRTGTGNEMKRHWVGIPSRLAA